MRSKVYYYEKRVIKWLNFCVKIVKMVKNLQFLSILSVYELFFYGLCLEVLDKVFTIEIIDLMLVQNNFKHYSIIRFYVMPECALRLQIFCRLKIKLL